MVITSRTRNAVVLYWARGFESHSLRFKSRLFSGFFFFLCHILQEFLHYNMYVMRFACIASKGIDSGRFL